MTIPPPICLKCKHFIRKGWVCKAFENGIPKVILLGENDHKKPLPKQENDIVFEAIEENRGGA